VTDARRTSGFALRELVLLALVAGLLVLSKGLFRISIHVPGHTGIFWMALLVIAKGIVRRNGAGTLVGLVSGMLAVMLVPGQEGIFTWVKYVAPGVALDVLGVLLPGGFSRPVQAAVLGALGNLAKLAAGYLLAVALGLPSGFIALGLGIAAVSHAAFGAAGGALGALMLQRLYRARPDLAPDGFMRRPAAPDGGGPASLGVLIALVLAATIGLLAGPAGPAFAATNTVWAEGTATRAFTGGEFSLAVRTGAADPAIVPRRDMLWSTGFAGLDPRSAQFVNGRNALVATRDGRAVLELDPAGRVVWSFNEADYRAAIGDPAAEFLPFHASRHTGTDGSPRTLITVRRGAPVIEVDASKRLVWRFGTGVAGFGPGQLFDGYSATRLSNGNTLIADNQGCRVLEVRTTDYRATAPNYGFTAASIVWSYGVGGELGSTHGFAEGYLDWPRTAVRLSNGNTLITDQAATRVVEVNPAGHVVWSYGTPGVQGRADGQLFEPSGAVRLPDGTTAIAHGKLVGEVVFVDSAGKVARRFPDPELTSPGFAMSEIRSISLSPSNSLLLGDEGNDRIVEVGVVPTAKFTSGRIDCGLPGVRKRFSALAWAGATPSGTSITVYYSIDGGPWLVVPSGGSLPQTAVGVTIAYRAVLQTSDNARAAQLDSVSITYAPDTGQGDPPDTPGKDGTGAATDATTTARGETAKPKPKPKPKTAPRTMVLKGASGGGSAASASPPVTVGGSTPPGLVEASGRVLGRVRINGTGSGNLGAGPGLGEGPQAVGGIVFLGGVYAIGLASAPTKALTLRLILRRW